MSVVRPPIHQLDATNLKELVTRLAAARRCGLLALLTLWRAPIVVLYEIVGFIGVGLIPTAFARLRHSLGSCTKVTVWVFD
jgi:hypothetical protein